MSNYDYRDHKTPHGIVEERYDEDDNFIYYFTNPRSQGGPRFQSGEELANSVGKQT